MQMLQFVTGIVATYDNSVDAALLGLEQSIAMLETAGEAAIHANQMKRVENARTRTDHRESVARLRQEWRP